MSAQIHHNCHDILAPKSRPITAAMLNSKKRKRMGSGDPSGLQNRRELASLALVSSTLTRFRHFSCFWQEILPLAQGASLRISARGSHAATTPQVSFAGSGEFDSHTLPPFYAPQKSRRTWACPAASITCLSSESADRQPSCRRRPGGNGY